LWLLTSTSEGEAICTFSEGEAWSFDEDGGHASPKAYRVREVPQHPRLHAIVLARAWWSSSLAYAWHDQHVLMQVTMRLQPQSSLHAALLGSILTALRTAG